MAQLGKLKNVAGQRVFAILSSHYVVSPRVLCNRVVGFATAEGNKTKMADREKGRSLGAEAVTQAAEMCTSK